MHTLTARALQQKFVKGELTATEIVTHFLKRIHAFNPDLNAFLTVMEEEAMAKARDLDLKRKEKKTLGRLAGVPIALKDNIHIKGVLSTCGSNFLKNYKAPFSSTVASLLEKEDAILIGKTNCDEFAMGSSNENSAFGPAKNPWNTSCTPGGSSGGSAAAVAAGLVPLALGSDTGGSIRQPAALCNLVGFKPTYGRVSRFGLVAYGSSLDQVGPFARNTEDAALLMEILGRHCEHDSTSIPEGPEQYLKALEARKDLQGLRVGIPNQFLEQLKGEYRARFDESVETLKKLGATVHEVDLNLLDYALATYYILATAEASTNLARFDGIRYGERSKRAETLEQVYDYSKEEGFGKEVKRRIMLGTFVLSAGYQDAYYKKGQKVRTLMIEQFKRAYKECHVIAMPTAPRGAFPFGSIKDPLTMYLEDIYTIGVNLVGLPAISIPCGTVEEGKPFGLQLLGPQKGDRLVFEVAHCFEKATPFASHLSPFATRNV